MSTNTDSTQSPFACLGCVTSILAAAFLYWFFFANGSTHVFNLFNKIGG